MAQEPKDYLWDYRDPYAWMRKVRSGLPPLMITCAITGGGPGKESHGNLPETAEEQALQTYEAYRAGACIVHVHGRDPSCNWKVSSKPEDYYRVNTLIREKCPDIIINNTTGGGPGFTAKERMASIYANPEMCSLNLGPLIIKTMLGERKEPLPHPRPALPVDVCASYTYGDIAMLAQTMKEHNIKPELEITHPGQYWVVQDLISQALLAPPFDFQFVMGQQTGSYATPANLLSLINELPQESLFTVIGVGQFQIPMNVMAILLGGHVRVGLEDNIYYSRGRKFKDNAEAVDRIVRLAKEMNREIATPQQARQMLGISPQPSRY